MSNQLESLIAKMREAVTKRDVVKFNALNLVYKLYRIEYRLRLKADNVPIELIDKQLKGYNEMVDRFYEVMKR
jgi:hypothetical protein